MRELDSTLIPLWCRARCAVEYPALGVGGDDAETLRRLRGADFALARRADCTLYALRERLMLDAAEAFLASRPGAALVDLGCGLDSLLRRVRGECSRRVFVDLPEIMELRRELLPPRPDESFFVADLRSGDFFERFSAPEGAFFVLSGLLCHLERPLVISLMSRMARDFPGCGLAFDGLGLAASPLHPLPDDKTLESLFPRGFQRVRRLPEPFPLPLAKRLKLSALLGLGQLKFCIAYT